MKNRFNALIANTNGLFLMEQEGHMPVQNAAVQICIDRIKMAAHPNAAVSGEVEERVSAGGKYHENMYSN